MIAIPLVVKKEPVGVLEILNKTEGPFTEDDHFLLLSLADEIAFAVRNAKIFEYVVNSYCKMRQGQRSCEGCKRPLGAWTPCIEYRKTSMTFPRSPKKP
jgi:transcriptional regulator with GAF, ATPase, and Fis domain